jgi:cellobionic acid phosphorylase
MIPGPDESDYRRRGQLPVFIPNYYRGDYHRHPEVAGRSSQLFNTGTVSWFYRCLIEGLFGLRGDHDGLVIQPQLPSHWKEARAVREFRGAIFKVAMAQDPALTEPHVSVDGQQLAGNRITEIEPGRTYEVRVQLPAWGPPATQRPTPTPGP